jgi:hypothetical protein
MRLNGIMALVAVVCVTGVIGSELLGPAARLRMSLREDADMYKGRSILAGLAGDSFQFPGPRQPLVLSLLGPISLAPRHPAHKPHEPRGFPRPVFSAVALLDGDDPGGDFVSPDAVQSVSEGLSPAQSSAVFTLSTEPAAFSTIPSLSSLFDGYGLGGGGGGANLATLPPPPPSPSLPPPGPPPPPPPPGGGEGVAKPFPVSASPEPASWLMLILGLGGVGLALRRRRARAFRSPSGAPEHLQS